MVLDKIPDEMIAVVLDSYSDVDTLRIENRSVPNPGPNEVLVKIAATPINPSDLAFIKGHYGFKKPAPVVPGFECPVNATGFASKQPGISARGRMG